MTLPHGTSYRVLVLPEQATMRPELLRKIRELVAGGATVVLVGRLPSGRRAWRTIRSATREFEATGRRDLG